MPPPSPAAQARTRTPKRSKRFLTATRPPERPKTKTPTRSRASWAEAKSVGMQSKRYPRGVVAWAGTRRDGMLDAGPRPSRRPRIRSTGRPHACRTSRSSASTRTARTCCSPTPTATAYVVPLDESLRGGRPQRPPEPAHPAGEAAEALRPAAVQALIRSGLSAEEVAERAGWTVEKVHRYEGPILAEREHVASLARRCGCGHAAPPTARPPPSTPGSVSGCAAARSTPPPWSGTPAGPTGATGSSRSPSRPAAVVVRRRGPSTRSPAPWRRSTTSRGG